MRRKGGFMKEGCFKVITDGEVFRIQQTKFGGYKSFWGSPTILEFSTKEEAERYIHKNLSLNGWKDA
jgi:hypothetical protein